MKVNPFDKKVILEQGEQLMRDSKRRSRETGKEKRENKEQEEAKKGNKVCQESIFMN